MVAPLVHDDIPFLMSTVCSSSSCFLHLLQMLLNMESGAHIHSPIVETIPVRALRIEPSSPGGYITVDGEVVPYGPVQAEVLPSGGRLLAANVPPRPVEGPALVRHEAGGGGGEQTRL